MSMSATTRESGGGGAAIDEEDGGSGGSTRQRAAVGGDRTNKRAARPVTLHLFVLSTVRIAVYSVSSMISRIRTSLGLNPEEPPDAAPMQKPRERRLASTSFVFALRPRRSPAQCTTRSLALALMELRIRLQYQPIKTFTQWAAGGRGAPIPVAEDIARWPLHILQ